MRRYSLLLYAARGQSSYDSEVSQRSCGWNGVDDVSKVVASACSSGAVGSGIAVYDYLVDRTTHDVCESVFCVERASRIPDDYRLPLEW
jgi:hypothetical protein